ncbi:MAG TPA: PilN domain-containing protein [Nitrospira sp.]|nr:PilN domain-containing protein [Nitrospira sp.]
MSSAVARFFEPLTSISLLRGADGQFQINLSRRYRPVVVPLRLLLIGSCVLLVMGIGWNLRQAILTYQASLTIQAELDRIRQQDLDLIAEARHEGVDLTEEALKRLPFEVELANQLLKKRTFSWTKFLTELEQAIPSRLVLSSVRLDQAGTMVRLTGTAMSLEDITAFTIGLRDHATFKDPILAQHRVGPNGLVEFDVTLQYRHEGT